MRVAVVEDIAREFGVDTVIMIPDEYPGAERRGQTGVKIITWEGPARCMSASRPPTSAPIAKPIPASIVLAHPECPPEVVAEADFAGSTAAMIGYVGEQRPKRVVMVTECSMSDNVAVEYPDVEFVRPCNLCPHMKRITLAGILHSLQTMTIEVTVDPLIAARARKAVDRMLAVGKPVRAAA